MTLASVEQMVGMAPAAAQTAVLPAVRERRELPGLRKAAVFIAQLSKEEAGSLLAKMRPREVELVTRELMKIGSVEPDDVDGVAYVGHQAPEGTTADDLRKLVLDVRGRLPGERARRRRSATTPTVCQVERSSRFTVAIAATQGV